MSLLLLGYGLDQMWVYTHSSPAPTTSQKELVSLLLSDLSEKPIALWQGYFHHNRIKAEIVSAKDLPQHAAVSDHQILPLVKDRKHYLLTALGGQLLLLGPYDSLQDKSSYCLPIMLFVMLTVIVVMCLWPLSQELKYLNNATQDFGQGKWHKRLPLKHLDYLSELACSFNLMAGRIERLLADQALMTRAVSHDLRLPLSRLRFAVAMNGHGPFDASIRKELNYLDQIVSHWSQFHELESVDAITKQVIELGPFLSRLLQNQGINLHPSLPDTLYADPHLLTRCLQNLLDNAQRFAFKRIYIGWEDNYLFVEDDGPGFNLEEKSKATELYFRGKKSNSDSLHLGIGLAMCQRIMELHNGSVILDDSPLGGARVKLRFPKA
ncbi:ATP-binding protein [Gallaecimonas mangrovi]|uniref:ATP-binding protein n=1 Tax=Gallaecimonas mangrovi TaxID=2291597 RepID=UPI001867E16A|nr:ATP-binding protein [Gallaecimonas mangrovi]